MKLTPEGQPKALQSAQLPKSTHLSKLAAASLALVMGCVSGGEGKDVSKESDSTFADTGDTAVKSVNSNECDALVAAATEDNTFVVTREDDPTPTNCDATDCSLREAVLASTTKLNESTLICLPTGTYTLEIPGTDEDAGLTGDLDLRVDPMHAFDTLSVRIEGMGSELSIIDANGIDRALEMPGDGSLSLNNLTIQNGSADRGAGVSIGGDTSLNIENVRFYSNHASQYGGALEVGLSWNIASDRITNSNFLNNTAAEEGGAIYTESDLTISGSQFNGNTALETVTDTWAKPNGRGGAIYGSGLSDNSLTLSNSTLIDNQADEAGAVYNSMGHTNLENNSFKDNHSTTGDGGAVALSSEEITLTGNSFDSNTAAKAAGALSVGGNGGTLTLTNNEFTGNTSLEGSGGAVDAIQIVGTMIFQGNIFTDNHAEATPQDYYSSGGAVNISRGTASFSGDVFENNTAYYSGGAVNWSSINDSLMVEDALFKGNVVEGGGGAIYVSGIDNTVFFKDTTFNDNTARYDNGGAAYLEASIDGSFTLEACTWGGNVSGDQGGAVFFESNGQDKKPLTIEDNTFEDNEASSDGGALVVEFGAGLIQRTTFIGNIAPSGGALYTDSSDLGVLNTTWYQNIANEGSAILIDSSVHTYDKDGNKVFLPSILRVDSSTFVEQAGSAAIQNNLTDPNVGIKNSVFGFNMYGGVDTSCSGAIVSYGFNVDSGACPSFTESSDLINTDPLLDPAGPMSNGGLTQTVTPLPGSPVINSGDLTLINGYLLTEDQRDVFRPQGVAPERGSHELEEKKSRIVR